MDIKNCLKCKNKYICENCPSCLMLDKKTFVCKHCKNDMSLENFYPRRTNECKNCLKEKIQCEYCDNFIQRICMTIHIKKMHNVVKPVHKSPSIQSPTETCKCCGEIKEFEVHRRICKDCVTLKLKAKVTCLYCAKVYSRGYLYIHSKLCSARPVTTTRNHSSFSL